MAKFKVSDLLQQQEEINKSLEELVISLCDFNKEPLGREFSGGLFGKKSLASYQEDKNEKQLDMWEITSNTESFRL